VYTLLLADDSLTIQRVIELTFADEDVEVVAVSDGDQAIERLESAPPDIVLADVGMPGRDGYEVARYVKQSPKLSHIPVVLLTGAFEPIDQTRAAEVGCDGILAKPFEPQLVIGRVKELLTQPRAPRASDGGQTAVPAPSRNPQLDEYFDRLDAAFTNLTARSAAPPPDLPLSHAAPAPAFDESPAPEAPPDETLAVAPPSVGPPPDDKTPAAPPETPVAAGHRATADDLPDAASAARPDAEHPRSSGLPPIAEAFAALLAAERGEPTPATRPAWPVRQPAVSETSDELVERVVQRVLERLSDRVVRETVSDLVSAIAERLVREEIEKIKSAIDERP